MKMQINVELNKLNDNELAYSKLLDLAIMSINATHQSEIPIGVEQFKYDIVDDIEEGKLNYKFDIDFGNEAINEQDIQQMLLNLMR